MRMMKKPLNLLVSEELINRARDHGINLSAFFEIKLQEHLALIHGKRYGKVSMDSSGFEPEASSMPRRRSSADLRAQKCP